MPYVDLKGGFSLYFEHVRPFDARLPTMVCLSPYMHSVTLLTPILNDPAFSAWNQILIELPYNGRGKAPVDPSYDHAVGAALVAFALEALGLPACHIYAPEVAAFHTATFLAVLFPDAVLSLAFAGVYSLFTPQTDAIRIFGEIDEYIVSAHSEDEFVEGVTAMIDTCLGDRAQYDPAWVEKVTDTMGAVFVNRYNPRFIRYLQHTTAMRQPHKLRPEHLAAVRVPVLVVHGGSDVAHPQSVAHEMYGAFGGSVDRQLLVIPGAPHCVDLTHEREVTARVATFLAPFTHQPAPEGPAQMNRCRAMHVLADITGDRSALSRDAGFAQSFTTQSEHTFARLSALFEREQARAAAYSLNVHLEGVSQPWEPRRPCEWTYTRRHDLTCLAVQEMQATRRASGGLVEVLTDTKVVKEEEPDWHVLVEPTQEPVELRRAMKGLAGLIVA